MFKITNIKLAACSALVTGAIAITIALSAPLAAAGYALNPSPPVSTQTTSASPPVRPNPDQQTAESGSPAASNRPPARDSKPAQHTPARTALGVPYTSSHPASSRSTTRQTAATAPSIHAANSGFDWTDGAIGAGIAATIALLIALGTRTVHYRSPPRHT